jgi:hypothetical protein
MCWEVVVVVVVVIIVMVVVAGAQNKKKKRLKKCASKATTSGPDVRVNSQSILFFFIPVSYKPLFIYMYAQLLTLVIYATFN